MKNRKLTDRQKRFVEEYLIDLNATQAAIRAGYKNAEIGRQLITKNNVSDAIHRALKSRSSRTEITQDRVLKEYARIAFFDPRNLFQDNGQPKDITALDDDTAAALAGLDVLEEYESSVDGKKFVGYTKKYKIADKLRALDSVAKHLGMFNDNQQNASDIEDLTPLSEMLGDNDDEDTEN